MKTRRIVFLALLIVFIGIQFFRPARNQSDAIGPNDITRLYNVPADVQTILKDACYDCHSNNTIYPWYANIQPVAWWLANHVNEGKEELNFSEFGTYSAKRRLNKLKKTGKEVTEGDMPLSSYTWMHAGARLTSSQKNTLTKWISMLTDSTTVNN
ncbi:heme-binding domain-containing protein [Chitinophaga sp. 212800010-3]|uniref:heme-binding domain-containing protein n=1 Tax=unclassified Chitinophaga TaxID=2619133 RepID=UPI002DE75055|nr:Heme-binding domain-containing protein [Chitinophaga sp. 212800010-3]